MANDIFKITNPFTKKGTAVGTEPTGDKYKELAGLISTAAMQYQQQEDPYDNMFNADNISPNGLDADLQAKADQMRDQKAKETKTADTIGHTINAGVAAIPVWGWAAAAGQELINTGAKAAGEDSNLGQALGMAGTAGIGTGINKMKNGYIMEGIADISGGSFPPQLFGYETQSEKDAKQKVLDLQREQQKRDDRKFKYGATQATGEARKQMQDRQESLYGIDSRGSYENNFDLYAEGGFMPMQIPKDFVIDNGGTHEENPNDGVTVGVNDKGQEMKLEEGEVKVSLDDGDYVFSTRLYTTK